MSYIDTSVIVAALDTEDPRHRDAWKVLSRGEDKIVSEMVLAELASVIARHREIFSILRDKLELSREEAIIAILLSIYLEGSTSSIGL